MPTKLDILTNVKKVAQDYVTRHGLTQEYIARNGPKKFLRKFRDTCEPLHDAVTDYLLQVGVLVPHPKKSLKWAFPPNSDQSVELGFEAHKLADNILINAYRNSISAYNENRERVQR